MLLNVVFIILGIGLVLWGADRLTDGAVAVAERLNVPQIVIGLTIVAVGTSMPEFCVSLVSAVKGTPDLAVGNIVGSNIFNALLIVGIAAIVAPMTILHSTVRKDIPFAMVASVLLLILCYDGVLSRFDAAVLLVMFAVFMTVTLRGAKESEENEELGMRNEKLEISNEELGMRNEKLGIRNEGLGHTGKDISHSSLLNPPSSKTILTPHSSKTTTPIWKAILLIILGLACLIVGSNIFVEGATFVAGYFGVSEAVIGLTVVAMGTSMPELATSVVAARKGNSGIAIGNVLGSNVFNILLILGATGAICPMRLEGITMTDFSVMVISMMLLWLFSFTKYTIQRWEGAVLTAVFIGYLINMIAPF